MLTLRDYRELFDGLAQVRGAIPLITQEIRTMSQAINDRIDQLTAKMDEEIGEVTAELKALRDEIDKGKLDEEQIKAKLDSAIAKAENIHASDNAPADPDPPPPVL